MINMNEILRKKFYFVSSIKTGSLTIIDALCNTILKEVKVGRRPFKLALFDDITIGVACDSSNTISLFNCISGKLKEFYISNNGDFQVDVSNKKIYVSNTYEITIYDIDLEGIIGCIKGFSAIVDLKLNKDGSKLYVLDTLQRELNIYNTDTYNLISSFKNIGANSNNLIISKDDKTAYISIKNTILKIEIISKIYTNLILSKGSIIAGMILKDDTLYASNLGLNRIDLINIHTNKTYKYILTSKPEPSRLFITEDNTKLLVANRSCDDYGGIDIIDLASNSVIGSILMNTINSQPYDVLSLNLPCTYIPPVVINELKSDKKVITIIAKKIFSSYNETFNFPVINITLPKNEEYNYIFQKITFEPGIIVKNSEFISRVSADSGLSNIKFITRVNYVICYLMDNVNRCINSFFEKPIDVFLDIPIERDLKEFDLNIKTVNKFIMTPNISYNIISFGITTLMELKVIGESEIPLTYLKENYNNSNENFEEFTVFNGPIFPNDTIIPF